MCSVYKIHFNEKDSVIYWIPLGYSLTNKLINQQAPPSRDLPNYAIIIQVMVWELLKWPVNLEEWLSVLKLYPLASISFLRFLGAKHIWKIMGHKEKGRKAERGAVKEVSTQSYEISCLEKTGTAQHERQSNCILLPSCGFAVRHFRAHSEAKQGSSS